MPTVDRLTKRVSVSVFHPPPPFIQHRHEWRFDLGQRGSAAPIHVAPRSASFYANPSQTEWLWIGAFYPSSTLTRSYLITGVEKLFFSQVASLKARFFTKYMVAYTKFCELARNSFILFWIWCDSYFYDSLCPTNNERFWRIFVQMLQMRKLFLPMVSNISK